MNTVHSDAPGRSGTHILKMIGAAALAAVLGLTMVAGSAEAAKRTPKVKVMTRNMYLGADLTPALTAPHVPALIAAAGEILRQVDRTKIQIRAQSLADEIRNKRPDLVGLQEVALWRIQFPADGPPPPNGPGTPATQVRYDFLAELMDALNQNGKIYRVVKVQREFDAELTGDYINDAPPGPGNSYGADTDGRLTMRDVILARVGPKIKTWGGTSGNFADVLEVTTAGGPLTVNRGYLSTNAFVRGRKFHFFNTHFEAFDPQTVIPSIRAKQAAQLAGIMNQGPRPVILVGDLNSDCPGYTPGDCQAYGTMFDAGFKRRSTNKPLSCCLSDPDLTGGSLADFDHKVDHIMTNRPRLLKMRGSSVVGLKRIGALGLMPSDHAGLVSTLRWTR